MSRTTKIALIGAQGFQRRDPNRIVRCYDWGNLSRVENLRDYDIVIVSLLNIGNVDDIDWASFYNVLNLQVMHRILKPRGGIIILGDPRFQIRRLSSENGAHIEEPFLKWTGVTFDWENAPGDTVQFDDDRDHRRYREYIQNLGQWEYSLRSCDLDVAVLGDVFPLEKYAEVGLRIDLQRDFFCCNRYGGALAFSVHFTFELEGSRGRKTSEYGPVIILPKIALNEDETINLVLQDLCGVESELPEPKWIDDVEAPGQKTVDEEIQRIQAELSSRYEDLQSAQDRRVKIRQSLKLLYDHGDSLEEAVREALRTIGAHVEDPQEPGKEDGWVTVQIGEETLEGVIEVKSTRNPQFTEKGLRQLNDWVTRGIELREKKYKGIFIGSNSIDEPPDKRQWPFSDSFKRSAELQQYVAIRSEDLYAIYVLSNSGKLTTEEFWRRLFNTNGIFDASSYYKQLSPKDKTGEE